METDDNGVEHYKLLYFKYSERPCDEHEDDGMMEMKWNKWINKSEHEQVTHTKVHSTQLPRTLVNAIIVIKKTQLICIYMKVDNKHRFNLSIKNHVK